jgi:hypothetical protein
LTETATAARSVSASTSAPSTPAVHSGMSNIQSQEDAPPAVEYSVPSAPSSAESNIQSPGRPTGRHRAHSAEPTGRGGSDFAATTVSEPSNVHRLSPAGAALNIQSGNTPERLNIQSAPGRLYDLDAFRPKSNIQETTYDKKLWKRSHQRPGRLIRRIKGYDIVENGSYGVSYVKVLNRKAGPGSQKTSSDSRLHEHAGFFTWSALERMGRVVKEKQYGRSETVSRTGSLS